MTNLTDVTSDQLQALKDFANAESKQLVDELEEILDDVAKTGQYIYPWHFMKPLYMCKLDQVTSEFLSASPPLKNDGTEDEEEIKNLQHFRDELVQTFDKFILAPFTLQRVSEMLTHPRKHYKTPAKFFRGLEKNILVVSTIDPVPSDQRPVLKRSRHDENPLEKQNGYVDTALKPQLKKIHLEETNLTVTTEDTNITEEEEGKQREEGSVVENDKAETPTTTTDKSQTTTDSPSTTTDPKCDETTESSPCDSSDDGLEHMLVCTESVDTPASSNNMDETAAPSNNMDETSAPSNNMDETPAPSNNMDETPAPSNNMDETPAPSNNMDASAAPVSTMDATAVSSAENESLGTDEKVVNESSPQPPATPEENTEIKTESNVTEDQEITEKPIDES